VMAALITHQRSAEESEFRVDKQAAGDGEGGGNGPDISEQASSEIAFVTESLPFTMSVNQLGQKGIEFDLSKKTVIKGFGKIVRDPGVGRANGITDFTRAKTARIVQVKIGSNKPGSLLGKIISFATSNTQAPILRDSEGGIHMPVGYIISSGGRVDFKFGLDNTIRTLKEINLGRTSSTDDVRLLYHVAAPRTITSFELGPNIQPLNLIVKEKNY